MRPDIAHSGQAQCSPNVAPPLPNQSTARPSTGLNLNQTSTCGPCEVGWGLADALLLSRFPVRHGRERYYRRVRPDLHHDGRRASRPVHLDSAGAYVAVSEVVPAGTRDKIVP